MDINIYIIGFILLFLIGLLIKNFSKKNNRSNKGRVPKDDYPFW